MDSLTNLPQEVLDDIQTALAQLESLVAQTSAVNGTLTYTSETVQSFTFAIPFADASYRVHVTTNDFIAWKVINPTVNGFDIELGSTYSGTIGFDVFV
jgi:hypothetical protein